MITIESERNTSDIIYIMTLVPDTMLTQISSDYTFHLVYFDKKNWITELSPELSNPGNSPNLWRAFKNTGSTLGSLNQNLYSGTCYLFFVIF